MFDFPAWNDTRCRRSNRSTTLITAMPRGYYVGRLHRTYPLYERKRQMRHMRAYLLYLSIRDAWGDVNDSRSAGGDRHAVVSIRKQFTCSWESISRRFNRAWRWYTSDTHASKRYGVFENGNEMNTVITDAVLYQALLENRTASRYAIIWICAIF